MVSKKQGIASVSTTITNETQTYLVWCASPGCVTEPSSASGVNVLFTGEIADETQKSFEVLVQSIGLRAMPIILEKPMPVLDLSAHGAKVISGEGYVWSFATEQKDVFATKTDKVGLLVEEIKGIVLPNGVVLETRGSDRNIEFAKIEFNKELKSDRILHTESL